MPGQKFQMFVEGGLSSCTRTGFSPVGLATASMGLIAAVLPTTVRFALGSALMALAEPTKVGLTAAYGSSAPAAFSVYLQVAGSMPSCVPPRKMCSHERLAVPTRRAAGDAVEFTIREQF